MQISWFAIILFLIHVACNRATEKIVQTPEQLQSALDHASPGDVITLAEVTFHGEFTASQNGTDFSPITVQASTENSKIVGNSSGVGFTILGNFWNLKFVTISGFDVGVLVKGTGNFVEALPIFNVNKAVHVQSKGNSVSSCAISETKLGIHVESGDSNVISSNSINDADPSIVVDQKTCCGKLLYNVGSGGVNLQGSRYSLEANVFNGILNITGCENTLLAESDAAVVYTTQCTNHDLLAEMLASYNLDS